MMVGYPLRYINSLIIELQIFFFLKLEPFISIEMLYYDLNAVKTIFEEISQFH